VCLAAEVDKPATGGGLRGSRGKAIAWPRRTGSTSTTTQSRPRSSAVWEDRFDADPNVLGRDVGTVRGSGWVARWSHGDSVCSTDLLESATMEMNPMSAFLPALRLNHWNTK
jgi:hypothetical protein